MALPLWLIGVIISVIGSIFSNFGQNVQKYSQMKNEELPPEQQKDSYLKQWRWWVGLGLVILGSLGDFTSLSFAPQSVVMPVGSVTLVANLFFASMWLGETLTRKDLVGTFMIIGGATLVALSYGLLGNPTETTYTLDQLLSLYMRWTIVIYFAIMGSLIFGIYSLMKRCEFILGQEGDHTKDAEYMRLARWHPFSYSALSGTFGANSVLFAKSTTELVRMTVQGENQFFKPLTYLIILGMFTCIILQTHFLAHGLQFFDALYIIPVFQCFFITFSIFGGAVYFNELSSFTPLQWTVFLLAVVLTLAGVVVLSSRDMDPTHGTHGHHEELTETGAAQKSDEGTQQPGEGIGTDESSRNRLGSSDMAEFEGIWSSVATSVATTVTLPSNPIVKARGKSIARENRVSVQERMRSRSSFVSFIGKPIDVILGRGEHQDAPGHSGADTNAGVDQGAAVGLGTGGAARIQSVSTDATNTRLDRMYSDRSGQSTTGPRTPPHARQSSRIRGTSVAYDAASAVGMGVSLFAFGYEKATGMNQLDDADSLMKQSDAAMSGAWDMSSLEPLELGETQNPGQQSAQGTPAVIEPKVNSVDSATAGRPSPAPPQRSIGAAQPVTTPEASMHNQWVKDVTTGRIISRKNLLDAKI